MDCNTDVLPVGVTELSSCRTNATLTGPLYCSATGDVPTENEAASLNKSHAWNLFPVRIQKADANQKPRGALAETSSSP